MAPQVNIAVVGTGLIGPRHAESVIKHPQANLICIVDLSPAAENVAAQLRVQLFKSVKDMLESTCKPDVAIVCTPNHTHVAVSKELLDGGVHVLVEKPISTDIESGQDLIRHASKLGLHLLVGHHRRFNSYFIAAKRAIESNSLGRVIAINGLWTAYKPASYFAPPAGWRASSIGGPVYINLIHEVDLLQYLVGPIVRVHAEKTLTQRENHEAEEGAAIVFRFSSGSVGTFLLSDAVPSPYNFEAGTGENPTIPLAKQDAYRIFGSEACLSVPDLTRWSYDGAKEKSWTERMMSERLGIDEDAVPFDLQIAHLVRVVRGEEQPSCTGQAGLQALMVCDAVKRSLQSGTTIDLRPSNL